MAKNKHHKDDVELTPEELGQASEPQAEEKAPAKSGEFKAVRHIIANGKAYNVGDVVPASEVSEQLEKSGAVAKG